MTYKTQTLVAILALSGVLASCLSSSESEITTYDDVAITAMTLGTAKYTRTIKKSDGTDSTYTGSYSASAYPLHIDQRSNTIFNTDSLVAGTNLDAILVSISTKNSGVPAWKNIDDENYTIHSSSDSVDLSQERTLIVFSNDGNHSREYKVKISVHTEFADSFTWNNLTANIAEELGTLTRTKALCAGGKLYLLGTGNGTTSLYATTDGAQWDLNALSGISEALDESASIAEYNGKLLLLNKGELYATADGTTWNSVCSDASIATIIGGCICTGTDGTTKTKELYALNNEGTFIVSHDDGATWNHDDMEATTYYDNSGKLPVTDINFIATKQRTNSDICRATIVANSNIADAEKDTLAVTWNKVVDAEYPQTWFFTNTAWNNHNYVLPRMQGLSATQYADGIVAFGGTPAKGSAKAYGKLYYSPDSGATWHDVSGMTLPEGFSATNTATIAADGKGYIYVISDGASDGNGKKAGQVWKGRKNSETWSK